MCKWEVFGVLNVIIHLHQDGIGHMCSYGKRWTFGIHNGTFVKVMMNQNHQSIYLQTQKLHQIFNKVIPWILQLSVG